MTLMASISDLAEINPRVPGNILNSPNRLISFVPMAAVTTEGKIIPTETRCVADTLRGFTYFKRGDVLLAKITPCMENGKAVYLEKLEHEVGFGSTEFHVLRPKSVVVGKYLFYMIWNPGFRYSARKSMTGTAGQKRVPSSFLQTYKIPLPGLTSQKRIAAILDKADALRQKRKQSLKLLDEFIRSVFLDMFGDPVINLKNWKSFKVEEIASSEPNSIKAGPFGSSLKKEIYVERGYKIYGQEQVIRDDLKYGNYFIDEEKYEELSNYKIRAGDILISLVGTFGLISIVPSDFTPGIINPRLMKITLDRTKIISIFFKYMLQTNGIMRKIKSASHGGTMDIVNVGIMRRIEIPVPPVDLQLKFKAIYKMHLKIKQKQEIALSEMEKQFNSLVYRAFRGEL